MIIDQHSRKPSPSRQAVLDTVASFVRLLTLKPTPVLCQHYIVN